MNGNAQVNMIEDKKLHDIDICEELHERLREARKRAGYRSARDFAQKQKIKERTYRSHETGEYRPSLEALMHYCRVLNRSPSWLILGNYNFIDKPFEEFME
jgi:DNA-binding XRE family transcriptional regulator